MDIFSSGFLQHLLDTWGYLAVFAFVAIESSGIPFPGETMLLIASVYAGSGHIDIRIVVISAALGAIIGDNLGFWAGYSGGSRLLLRYGRFLRIDEKKIKRAQQFYDKHGDKTVFFGRFVAVLRAWAAFLAGVNHMKWQKFLLFNAAGGILWAVVYGTLGYILAQNLPLLNTIVRDLGFGSIAVAVAVIGIIAFVWWKRRQMRRS